MAIKELSATQIEQLVGTYDAATGKEIWRLADNLTQVKVPTPVVAGGLVIVTGGYLFVANNNSNNVTVISTSTNAVVETIAGLVEAGFAKGAKPDPQVPAGIDKLTWWQRTRAAIRRIVR